MAGLAFVQARMKHVLAISGQWSRDFNVHKANEDYPPEAR